MSWRRWCSGQWGQSWFLQETSTCTWRERADGDLTRRSQWRWRRWDLRTSQHTSSLHGESVIDIRDRGRWWNRGGWWGPGRTIFWFLAWLSRTHNTTPAHSMVMVCLRFASLRDQSYYLGCRIRLPLCPPGRQTRRQVKNIFAEFRRAVQSKTNWQGITTCGFPSRCGELCMIVYMSPLQSKSTFFLYSPTILLETKKFKISMTFFVK